VLVRQEQKLLNARSRKDRQGWQHRGVVQPIVGQLSGNEGLRAFNENRQNRLEQAAAAAWVPADNNKYAAFAAAAGSCDGCPLRQGGRLYTDPSQCVDSLGVSLLFTP